MTCERCRQTIYRVSRNLLRKSNPDGTLHQCPDLTAPIRWRLGEKDWPEVEAMLRRIHPPPPTLPRIEPLRRES